MIDLKHSPPGKRWAAPLLFVLLTACSTLPPPLTARTDALLPTEVILLGEQHDASAHQQIHQQVVAHLAARGQLSAVALEMAEAGRGTAGLPANSSEQQVQDVLGWNNKSWPWAAYGPAVMTAVRAGVPVLGANLPAAQMRDAMADNRLDQQLPGPALKAQQQLIRLGHCSLLPEDRISPMTRIQVARDMHMARTVEKAVLPGKVVVLLAGSGHVNRVLGVPQHLPPELKIQAVLLRAGPETAADTGAFDVVWNTPALPVKDYCGSLKK
ncbi:ChaN family lipoprotein [Polaromonas sp. SM01]|uniref:ChaN family lipoprotein n=1 Tax=Polaromonas sp. SM01 TaxID=3085630 RepID=UPI002981F8F0|nr:ChaN family lipoprotein [Polaromonas sp. SM01]MDW5442548.1 ChaN family lipoprotein [Polaromonas sp. SM01]